MMKNKKLIFGMVGLVLLVGAAAFVAGRMLNNQVGPLGFFGFGGKGGAMEINLIRATELPATEPQAVGLFAERADNIIVVQMTSLKTGGSGIVVHKDDDGGNSPSANMEYGPKVEILLTKETVIYRDVTPPVNPSAGEARTVQQILEKITSDDLAPNSYVSVWGRKSGDRIIAEVVLLDTPVLSEGP